MPRAIVVGGSGTFGGIVARAIAARGLAVTLAARRRARAERLAAELAGGRAVSLDAADRLACAAALRGHDVAVLAAGPFSRLGLAFHEAALESACHAVDIAEDRAFVAAVRAMGPRFASKGLAAVTGASALPGVSLALALAARERHGPLRSARVALFVGNDNEKGRASVETIVAQAGRRFAAPGGPRVALRSGFTAPFPPPVGTRTARFIESPELDLFPALLGASGVVEVGVAFERDAIGRALAFLARTWARGPVAAAALAERSAGLSVGALTAPELLGWKALLSELEKDGITVVRGEATSPPRTE